MRRKPAGTSLVWLAIGVLAALHGSHPLHAETSAQFDVSATIASGCSVDGTGLSGDAGTMGVLDFGTDSTFSSATHTANITATQSIRLRCTPGVSVAIRVNGGSNLAGGARHLQLGADQASRIIYALCADAACTQPFAIDGVIVIAATTGTANDVKLPIYGKLALPGNIKPGTYQDAVTVTLSW